MIEKPLLTALKKLNNFVTESVSFYLVGVILVGAIWLLFPNVMDFIVGLFFRIILGKQ